MKLAAAGVRFIHHDDVQAVYRRHRPSVTGDRARMTRGFLLALGHARRRVSSRWVRLLIVYRYVVEFERAFTDWILRRHETAIPTVVRTRLIDVSAPRVPAARRAIEAQGRRLAASWRVSARPPRTRGRADRARPGRRGEEARRPKTNLRGGSTNGTSGRSAELALQRACRYASKRASTTLGRWLQPLRRHSPRLSLCCGFRLRWRSFFRANAADSSAPLD